METAQKRVDLTQTGKGRAPIIAVDFDGTLCVNKWPGIGEPVAEMLAFCTAKKAAGVRLILWTNRTGDRLAEAVDWCRLRGLEFDAVNANLQECIDVFGGDCRKVYADMYIDDKAAKLDEIMRAGNEILELQKRSRLLDDLSEAYDKIEELTAKLRGASTGYSSGTRDADAGVWQMCEDCKPMTNGDRIRNMKDEELANYYVDAICHMHKYCPPSINCIECALNWLKQEVSEYAGSKTD